MVREILSKLSNRASPHCSITEKGSLGFSKFSSWKKNGNFAKIRSRTRRHVLPERRRGKSWPSLLPPPTYPLMQRNKKEEEGGDQTFPSRALPRPHGSCVCVFEKEQGKKKKISRPRPVFSTKKNIEPRLHLPHFPGRKSSLNGGMIIRTKNNSTFPTFLTHLDLLPPQVAPPSPQPARSIHFP